MTVIVLISTSLFLVASVGDKWDDCKAFISAIGRNPKEMGAILPSSKDLAEKITRLVMCKGAPVAILEVGAGTGSFSAEIIKKMRPQDQLVLIELDPELCKLLKQKFGSYKNVRILCMSFLDWAPEHKYDFIVSGIPHHNLETEILRQFLKHYRVLLKKGGIVSFFEYIGASTVRSVTAWFKDDSPNSRMLKYFASRFAFQKDHAVLNVPPARVHHLRIS